MNRLICLLLSGILFPLVAFIPASVELTPKEKRQYALALLQEYDPEGWSIIKKVDTLAFNNAFDRYADGNTEAHVREAVGTMVHECHHGYSALMAWRLKPNNIDQYACAYLGEGKYQLIKFTPVFPTEEMGKTIPAHLRTLRFATYIYNPKEKIRLSSNTYGIYGLLDEYIAYYHGTVADVNMHRWYQEHTNGTTNDWYAYFSTVGSVINAHVEFKFYCLAYLLYAQKHKPEVYKAIIRNEDFVNVFLRTDREYGNLIKSYAGIKSKILNNLKAKGAKIGEDNEWIYLNRQAVGNFVNEYKALENELKKPAYQTMMQTLQASAKPAKSSARGDE